MAFTNGNDMNTLQATDNKNVSAGAGDDKYILSNGGGITAGQIINIIDTEGANTLQLIGGLTIASSKATANVIQLTLSNGGIVNVQGANTFSFEVGGDPLNNVAGIIQKFGAFVTTSLGLASVPTSNSTVVTGATNVAVKADGSTSVAPVIPTITLPVGQTAASTVTKVTATANADVFTLNVAAAKASAPNTQDSITGFAVSADSLSLTGTGIAAGSYNLGNTLTGVTVSPDAINNQTIVSFGLDATGDLISVALVGVTTPSLVNVTVIS